MFGNSGEDTRTPEQKEIATWRQNLAAGGVVMLVVAALLQWWNSSSDSVVETKTSGDTVTATTTAGGPPDSLIATALAAAILLLLVAAFFSRVEKISAFGIDISLTKAEEKEVVDEAVTTAKAEGITDEEVPAFVATSLQAAVGAKAMVRNGVAPPTPRAEDFSSTMVLDPKVLAQLSVLTAVHKYKSAA